jgi:AcrR family transcriptional regulator
VNPIKRQQIIDAMLEAVGAEGYEATSVRTVLDRSGLYRQAFYDFFEGKEDCYLQAHDEALRRVEAGVRATASTEADWRGELRAGLGALLDFLDGEPNVARALIVEVHPAGAAGRASRVAAMQRVYDFLGRGRIEGDGAGAAPTIAPEAIASGIHMVIHSRLAARGENNFQQLLPEFMYFAVLPYFGPDAARAEMQTDQR